MPTRFLVGLCLTASLLTHLAHAGASDSQTQKSTNAPADFALEAKGHAFEQAPLRRAIEDLITTIASAEAFVGRLDTLLLSAFEPYAEMIDRRIEVVTNMPAAKRYLQTIKSGLEHDFAPKTCGIEGKCPTFNGWDCSECGFGARAGWAHRYAKATCKGCCDENSQCCGILWNTTYCAGYQCYLYQCLLAPCLPSSWNCETQLTGPLVRAWLSGLRGFYSTWQAELSAPPGPPAPPSIAIATGKVATPAPLPPASATAPSAPSPPSPPPYAPGTTEGAAAP